MVGVPEIKMGPKDQGGHNSWSPSTQEYKGLTQEEYGNQNRLFMGQGARDNDFYSKRAEFGTMTEYPGGEVQLGTGNMTRKFQGEIKQDQS